MSLAVVGVTDFNLHKIRELGSPRWRACWSGHVSWVDERAWCPLCKSRLDGLSLLHSYKQIPMELTAGFLTV